MRTETRITAVYVGSLLLTAMVFVTTDTPFVSPLDSDSLAKIKAMLRAA